MGVKERRLVSKRMKQYWADRQTGQKGRSDFLGVPNAISRKLIRRQVHSTPNLPRTRWLHDSLYVGCRRDEQMCRDKLLAATSDDNLLGATDQAIAVLVADPITPGRCIVADIVTGQGGRRSFVKRALRAIARRSKGDFDASAAPPNTEKALRSSAMSTAKLYLRTLIRMSLN
jgi:hypothetical protein